MQFNIKLADKIISINSLYPYTKNMCKDYIIDSPNSDLTIVSTPAKIEIERKNSKNDYNYSSGYLESLSIYREISEQMTNFSTFLMHGSVVAVDDNAFMFSASSSVGKTTRTKLWLDQIPESYVINGDKPLFKICNDKVLVCGTPWAGKEKMNTNAIVPLRAIFILERSENTTLEKITFSEAFIPLLRQTYHPSNSIFMSKTLNLLKQLEGKVSFYRFKSSLHDADMKILYNEVMHS